MARGLSKEFLSAMREGLNGGIKRGYDGWDKHWKGVIFPTPPLQFSITRLHQEMDELLEALNVDSSQRIMREAADVANFAMFIADYMSDT